MKLPMEYFQQEDVVFLAQDILGKYLITEIDGIKTGGIITETEAYCQTERGCHAYNGKRTPRTEIMFERGGYAYIYFCYGMHYLFNIVTGKKDWAQAVLIRAIQPTIGVEYILQRRKQNKQHNKICDGPAKTAQALGLTKLQNGILLQENVIYIEENKIIIDTNSIQVTKRIGIDYAGKDALLPWRFQLKI